jgi:hypothetical protein
VLTTQRHEVVGVRVEPLEAGQVVGDRRLSPAVERATEVPGGPGAPLRREHGGVGVQQRDVVGVRQGGEDLALGGRRIGQHREGLVGVRGDHDGVVRPHLAVAIGDGDPGGGLRDRGDLAAGPDLGEGRDHPVDVLLGAAGDRAPLRGAEDAEHPVVLEEAEQVARRVVQREVRVARPDRGHQRLHEVPLEVRREAALGEELAERPIVLGARE